MVAQLYQADADEKLDRTDRNFFTVSYERDCLEAVTLKANSDTGAIFARIKVRCRKCGPCLRARTNYWGFAAMQVTKETAENGLRTWFGTLTINPASMAEFDQRALEASGHSAQPPWWDESECDAKFTLLRNTILIEVQKYWKRLRKQGHSFKYFLVFERHKSGLPHMHFLLHEQKAPILKRQLVDAWPWGFSKMKLVGGRSASAPATDKASWYVVKYLSKSYHSKQIASNGYRPGGRSLDRKPTRSQSQLRETESETDQPNEVT